MKISTVHINFLLIVIYLIVFPFGGLYSQEISSESDSIKVYLKKNKWYNSKLDSIYVSKKIDGANQNFFQYFKSVVFINERDSATANEVVEKQLHQIEYEKNVSKYRTALTYIYESEWCNLQKIDVKPHVKKIKKVKNVNAVYGFHPFWMGQSYFDYDFSSLDRIAYAGYLVDPKNGDDAGSVKFVSAQSWLTSPIHSYANYSSCKVDLLLASYDKKSNKEFFSNSKSVTNLLDSVFFLLDSKGDGICLDFQNLDVSLTSDYISFVERIREKMNEIPLLNRTDSMQITIVLPLMDYGVFDNMTDANWTKLEKVADRFILNGHHITKNAPKTVLPSSNYWDYELINSRINQLPLNVYLKTILEIPLISSFYATKGRLVPVPKLLPHNDSVLNQLEVDAKRRWLIFGKKNLDTTYTMKLVPGSTFYDTLKSDTIIYDSLVLFRNLYEISIVQPDILPELLNDVRERMEFVKRKGLKGVAIWNLGYSYSIAEMKNLIIAFGGNLDLNTDPAAIEMLMNVIANPILEEDNIQQTQNNKLSNILFSDANQVNLASSLPSIIETELPKMPIVFHHVVVMCLVILLFFVLLGLIISLFFESVREVVFSNQYLVFVLSALVIITMVMLLYQFEILIGTELIFLLGIVIGVGLTIFIRSRKKTNIDEERP